MMPEFHAHALGAPEMSMVMFGTAGVAILHTLAGPDHFLPFIVMGRARRWSTARTVLWTTLCGLGHVGSSVLLALLGAAFGSGLERILYFEGLRGNLAAWAMIAFGLVYLVWGLKKVFSGQAHSRLNGHDGGQVHEHRHALDTPHAHLHGETEGFRLSPWILFTIFILGPCEPMIPLIMYPAAQGSWSDVWTVVLTFGALTIASMILVVLLALKGISLLPTRRLERFNHALAGGTILVAGCAIGFLGL